MSQSPISASGSSQRGFTVREVEGGYVVTQSSGNYSDAATPYKERQRVAPTLTAVGKMLRKHFTGTQPEEETPDEKPIG